jgi:hypothetical protein
MIRDANQFDKKDIIDMCVEFRDSADFDEIFLLAQAVFFMSRKKVF